MAIIAGGTNYASVFNFLPSRPHRRFDLSRTKADHKSKAEFRANNFQRSHLRRPPPPASTAAPAINLLTHSNSTYLFVSIELRACMAQTGPHVNSWKQITLKYGLLFPHYSPWVLQSFSVSSAISALLWFLIDEKLWLFVIYVQYTWMETRNLSNGELKKENRAWLLKLGGLEWNNRPSGWMAVTSGFERGN